MKHPLAVVVLLACGCGMAVVFSIALATGRDFYERLHFVAPIALLTAPLAAIAVFVNERFSAAGIKALLILVFLTIMSPVLTHATARAGRIRELGRWKIRPEETHRGGAPSQQRGR